MTRVGNLTLKLFLGWLAGLFLAVLAFSQAAASIGIAIDSFRPLGAGFFSWRSGQTRLAISVFDPEKKVDAKRLLGTGRSTLALAPLTPRSLWLVGKGMEIQGKLSNARQAMKQAERVSRRDGAVQLWLGHDALRNGAADEGLRHFDLMIRGDRRAASEIMPALAAVMISSEGRRHLARYIRSDNPWLLDVMQTAVTRLPQSAPIARLLIDRGAAAPDVPLIRPIYAQLVARLVREEQYRLALQLHPLLPGARKESLRSVGLTAALSADDGGYPPFVWAFGETATQAATLIGFDNGDTGLEISGAPGTIGIAASKLVTVRPGSSFRWQVVDRTPNIQASAHWELTCLLGPAAKRVSRSSDLLALSTPTGRMLQMAMPKNCSLARIDMHISGGIGRNPALLTIGKLATTAAAN